MDLDLLQTIPALTLRNPWGHLVAHYGKDVENRSWMPPESLTRMFIHAGKGNDPTPEFMRTGDWGNPHASAIVAVVDIAHACEDSRWLNEVKCGCGGWAMPSQCHWSLTNVLTLPEPVPCAGRQGLWRPDRGVVVAIGEQLAGAVA